MKQLNLVAILLVLISPVSFVSASIKSPYMGAFCEQNGNNLQCYLYTAQYEAQVGVTLKGIYRNVNGTFALQVGNDLVRLILYCKNGTLARAPPPNLKGNETDGGYRFCTTAPFTENQPLVLKGTVISPSEAPGFTYDLYVIWVLET